MGTALAIKERQPPVPDTPGRRKDLKEELREYADKIGAVNHLELWSTAIRNPQLIGAKDAHYFLLELDPIAKQVKVTGYKPKELERASADYLTIERSIGQAGRDAVLVSVDSLAALRTAYPNYFLDMHSFIREVKVALRNPHLF